MEGELAIGAAYGYSYVFLSPYHHPFYNCLSAIMKGPSQDNSLSTKKSWRLLPALLPTLCHLFFDVVPSLESLYPASGVNDSLLAGKERVTLAANLHLEQWLRRAGSEGVTTSTNHFCFHIFGMNLVLHPISTPKPQRRRWPFSYLCQPAQTSHSHQ